jgi:carboxyl-terminal processing protease
MPAEVPGSIGGSSMTDTTAQGSPRRHSRFGRNMRAMLLLTLAIGCSGLGLNPGRAEDAARQETATAATSAQPSRRLLEAILDAVVEKTMARYFDIARLAAVDFRAKAAAQREEIVTSASLTDAARRINALLALLETSHTAFYTRDDVQFAVLLDAIPFGDGIAALKAEQFWGNVPSVAGIGIFTARVGERHFIDGVLQGSPAARAGLMIGDEIVDVDGAPYHPIRSFRGKTEQTAILAIRRLADGPIIPVAVPVRQIAPGHAFTSATRESVRIFQRGGRRIGYMQVWASKNADAFRTALSRLSPGGVLPSAETIPGRSGFQSYTTDDVIADTPLDILIIDMRGRIGGSSATTRDYLAMIGAHAAAYNYVFRGRDDRRSTQVRRNPPFRGRAILLTDHHTRSAAELFAYAFRREGMGPLIGTRTAGAVSGGGLFAMPGGNLLYLAVSGIEADGSPLEGKGVSPDIVVERPLPYSSGADPVLDAALTHAEKMELPPAR